MPKKRRSSSAVIDKTWKFFFTQALYGFIEQDYETGMHFLGELQEHYNRHAGKFSQTIEELSSDLLSMIQASVFQGEPNPPPSNQISQNEPAVKQQPAFFIPDVPSTPNGKNQAAKIDGEQFPTFSPKAVVNAPDKMKTQEQNVTDGSDQLDEMLLRRQRRNTKKATGEMQGIEKSDGSLFDDLGDLSLVEEVPIKSSQKQRRRQPENTEEQEQYQEKLKRPTVKGRKAEEEDVFDRIFKEHLGEKDYRAITKKESSIKKNLPPAERVISPQDVPYMSEMERELLGIRLTRKQNNGTLTDVEKKLLNSLHKV